MADAPTRDAFKLRDLQLVHDEYIKQQELMEGSLLAAARDHDSICAGKSLAPSPPPHSMPLPASARRWLAQGSRGSMRQHAASSTFWLIAAVARLQIFTASARSYLIQAGATKAQVLPRGLLLNAESSAAFACSCP